MKKFLMILCALVLLAPQAEARHTYGHHHGGHGVSVHHCHKGNAAVGFFAGLIGGTILNAAFNQPRASVSTTYTAPVAQVAPVAQIAPVAQVVPTVQMTTTQPCYTTTNIVTGAISTYCSNTIISPLF